MARNPIDIPPTVVVTLPSVEGLALLADHALIEVQRQAGDARRRVDAVNAAIAGEIARRSDRVLGHRGLAARLGASTPEGAIQSLTGVSLTDAKAMTAVGAALGAGSPWLEPVVSGVVDGSLSVAAAAAITGALGAPTATVAADDLLDAATELVELARESTPESTARSARTLREHLDVASISDLEAHRRSRRSLRWFEQPDGMTRMVAMLDPESAAIITGAIDTVMSPRRGGPRFVDTEQAARATEVADDPRTNDQYAVDTLVEIVNLATRAAGSTIDQVTLFGDRSPAVRVHIQADTLRSTTGPGHTPGTAAGGGRRAGAGAGAGAGAAAPGAGAGGTRAHTRSHTGAAYIEGQTGFVSTETAERYICTSGTLPIVLSGSTAIDAGNTHRLHTPRQRIAIAAQWNGCAWPDCPRSAFMTEVHHIDAFDGTNTTLSNAIPLCRFHHMELHANHWQITRRTSDGTHWLHPPTSTAAAGTQPPDTSPAGTHGEARQLRSKGPLSRGAP